MHSWLVIAAVLIATFAAAAGRAIATQSAVVPLPLASYPDSRRIDTRNDFANVGALITMADRNDAGVPEGNLGQCSGTLIDERVVLTAGHCVCPGLPTPPPFVHSYVSFAPDARDRSTWLPVAKIAGHPSLPPCLPPRFIEAYGAPPVPKMHDVGLVFLAEPVRDIHPARLAARGALDRPQSMHSPMLVIGYGHLQSMPAERRWEAWDGLRRVRSKPLVQVIDDAWATLALPGEVCNGDSGGPVFAGSGGSDRAIVATVSWVGGCRGGSIHARIDVEPVQTWIAQTISANVPAQTPFPWSDMARRIVSAIQVERGERVMLRFDPQTMRELEPEVARQLRAAGAEVESHPFGPLDDFARRLTTIDVYVWLPAGPTAATPAAQSAALVEWIDARQDRRELHFHWVDGTRDADGLPVPHRPAYDRIYLDALDIDYAALARQMDAAIGRLRAGEVRVTTAAGTDVRFRVGDRPFNRQVGDASKANAREGRIRIDRHTELPAGVLRVAPIETSVNGVLVLPAARFGAVRATNVRLTFRDGVVVDASAASGLDAVKAFIASEPGASRFREFALGFNPRLTIPTGEQALPYYGYGAGIVRMSLGDNSELGGSVRGGGIRWLFFPDATVIAGGASLVDRGQLVSSAPR